MIHKKAISVFPYVYYVRISILYLLFKYKSLTSINKVFKANQQKNTFNYFKHNVNKIVI